MAIKASEPAGDPVQLALRVAQDGTPTGLGLGLGDAWELGLGLGEGEGVGLGVGLNRADGLW